jgi:serine protease Do
VIAVLPSVVLESTMVQGPRAFCYATASMAPHRPARASLLRMPIWRTAGSGRQIDSRANRPADRTERHFVHLLMLTLAGAIAGASAAFTAEAQSLPDLLEKIRPSVVGVGTHLPMRRPPSQISGTGFVVSDGRHVITNFHVIPSSLDQSHRERLVVFVGSGRKPSIFEATVVASDAVHDLALLEIDTRALTPLALAPDDSVREGEDIAFTGYPIGAVLGLYPVTHRGIVSAISPVSIPARHSSELTGAQIRALRAPYDVLQLDATAYPGNSGSPVYLHKTGKVVGVINKVHVKGTKETALSDPSGITYAIPVRFVRELLAAARALP